MTEKGMLKALSETIKERGIMSVTMDLNYDDPRSIKRWLSIGKIPKWRHDQVKMFLSSVRLNQKKRAKK